ncbi:aldehyde dehydrogenase family protein [Nocardioides sp. LML1-1-1.1]|uniref:aldehyde dehydrogenase family protein n=1 Tax=Nocardioides sp. LML1-1-1.1 TaxID=3135248 RepID=UPI00342913BB
MVHTDALDRVEAIRVTNPVDGTTVGEVPQMSGRDVEVAVAALREHQQAWEGLGAEARAGWLRRWSDWLWDHELELVALLQAETGKPRVEAGLELGMAMDLLNYYAKRSSRFLAEDTPLPHNLLTSSRRLRTVHRPYPVVGVIVPWNFPLGLALFDAVPALLAGAGVVLKPSEFTPVTVRRVVEGWREIGAPGVLTAVTGYAEVGEVLVDTVDYVQFTGSTRTGRLVAARAAARPIPCGLELGGKDPALVLDDADVDTAARGVVFGALSNLGQMCTSIERVYVADSIHDAFVSRVVHQVRGLRQVADTGHRTDLGAMTTAAQADLVMAHVADAVAKGATTVLGGERDGQLVRPTVLVDVDHTMDVMTEETFGPIIPIMRVADDDEAVRLANDSEYGLSASVWTSSTSRGRDVAARIEAGAVDINDVSMHLACFPVPQAGWKSSGVGGRLGGAAGVRKFCRPQVVTTSRAHQPLVSRLAWHPYGPLKAVLLERSLRALTARGSRRLKGGAR